MEMERAQKRVVVDAGHGGVDPGAVANGLKEKDFTLEASNYINKRLNELGIPSKVTRSEDETLNKTERIRRILTAFGNDKDVIVLSNHINAGGGDGAEAIYALRNNSVLSNNILQNINKEGQNIRSYYQRRLPSDPSKDYYFIHRETGNTEPVLIEYAFIDSPKDDVKQLQNNLLDYAEAVVKAVSNYAGVLYKPPVVTIPTTYTVQKGDSLWSIAKKYNTTVEELVMINNLPTNILSIGQILKLPSINQTVTADTYIVQKGDSLWSIAKKYNISVDQLKMDNGLTTNLLSIGQILKIPSVSNNGTYKLYTVQKGDSLWSISKKYNMNVQDLIDYNNLTNNLLSIGQILKIPS